MPRTADFCLQINFYVAQLNVVLPRPVAMQYLLLLHCTVSFVSSYFVFPQSWFVDWCGQGKIDKPHGIKNCVPEPV